MFFLYSHCRTAAYQQHCKPKAHTTAASGLWIFLLALRLISRGAVRPVAAGALPEDILCLTLRHCGNQAQVVRAYETKDLDVAFNGFLNDPEMTCGLNDATELYRDMLSEVRKHLIYYCED